MKPNASVLRPAAWLALAVAAAFLLAGNAGVRGQQEGCSEPAAVYSQDWWQELAARRAHHKCHAKEQEAPAKRKLKCDVRINVDNVKLREALQLLVRQADVELLVDPRVEDADIDEVVSVKCPRPIMLRSALELVLQPLHLDYMVQDNAVIVRPESTCRDDTETISVADLELPPESLRELIKLLRDTIQSPPKDALLGPSASIVSTWDNRVRSIEPSADNKSIIVVGSEEVREGIKDILDVCARTLHPSDCRVRRVK